jgi:predicted solute-binding protein
MPKKSVACVPHLYADPCRRPSRGARLEWTTGVAARNAIGLRDRSLQGAFLTPIDYARESSLFYVIPDVAVASAGGEGSVMLHFRESLTAITSVAVNPSSSSEIVLARILLAEQFDSTPSLVPFQGNASEGLARADAVLCVGDDALRERRAQARALDLVEEWNEMTGLPYVHGFWAVREKSLRPEEIREIQKAPRAGRAALEKIAAEAARAHGIPGLGAEEAREYLEQFSYDFTEQTEASLRELYRFAYFHGILPDVADLQFADPDAPQESEAPNAD